jgi:hypothetical protein
MKFGSTEFNDNLIQLIKNAKYRHPSYEKVVEIAKQMSVHVYGDKPLELLDRVRPGEDEKIKQYRVNNYEATTKAPCGKAIKIVSKMFNPNLASIKFNTESEASRRLMEYTTYYFPEYNSLLSFNKDVTLKKMIADPNALMAVKPMVPVQNDAEPVRPVVVIYGSPAIWWWDYEHYLISVGVSTTTGSPLDKPKKVFTFEYYDDTRFIKFDASVGPDDSLTITELPESYVHNFTDKEGYPTIPAWKLRGNTIALDSGMTIYESFFADAQPHWNLSIVHESDLLGAFVKHMNPQRYIIGEQCTNEIEREGIKIRCYNGVLMSHDGKYREQCPACHGTGKTASSPYEDHVVLKSKLDEMQNLTMDPIGYVKVPTEATQLLQERADACVDKGSAAINMDIEDKVGENQSGIAKVYDRSAQNDTIYDMACVMFDIHFQNQYYFIDKYLNSVSEAAAGRTDSDKNLPQINKPTRFNIESIAELIAGFKAGKDGGLDRSYMQAKTIEIINREFETDPERKTYYSMLINLDPLYFMSDMEINGYLNRGLVKKTDVVIHANLKMFVDRAIEENQAFINLKKSEQLAKLTEYAQELITEEEPNIEPPEI